MKAAKTVLWCVVSLVVWIGCGDNLNGDLEIDPSTLTVMVGEEAVISARRGATEVAGATWTSSNEAIARVTPGAGTATVRGVSPGMASITATIDGVVATTAVTVIPAGLVSIAITPPTPSIAAGTTAQLTATGMYSDGTTADVTATASWSSATAAIATVDATGKLTGVGVGTSVISAMVGSVRGSVTATVTAARLVAIDVTPAAPSLARGTTAQLTATGRFTDNTTQDLTSQVTWSSATTTVATVSSTGLVSAANVGTSVVTASLGTVSGSVTVTVTPAALTAIDVTPINPSIARGLTQQFTATGRFSDTTTQDLTTMVAWTSGTPATATISNAAGSQGLATAVDVGTTLITATLGAISGSTTLTVTAATLVSIQVTPVNPSIAKGLTQQLTATGTYTDATTQDLTTLVTWTSGTPAVATISNAAGSQGLATAADVGTTLITATSGTVSGSTTLTVTPAVLVSIAVTPTNPLLPLGTSRQLTATGTFSDTTTQNLTASVTWTSSDTAVAQVSNATGSEGLATAVGVGTATVSATSGSITGSTTLTVTAVTLVSIAITPADVSIPNGLSQQYTATGTYSDTTTQDLTQIVTWSSSNAAVAQISNAPGSEGLAQSTGLGTTTISATSGTVTGSTTLTVTAAALVSIAVTPANASIPNGLSQQYTATGTYTDTTTQDLTQTVTWSSSNAAVAQISNAPGSEGLAQSTGLGTTTISATSGTVTGSTTLTVTAAILTSIAVTPANASLALGRTLQYTATGTFSDASTQDLTTTATWISSDPGVAAVSNAAGSQGLATSVSIGSTTISATLDAITGSSTLTVTPAELVSIAVTPQAPSIEVGQTVQLTATGTFSDTSTADITAMVTWTSQAPAVATVSATGLVTGVGTTSGTAQIDATLGTVTGSTTVTVTAVPPTVILTTPPEAAIDVSPTRTIEVSFSLAMAPASLTTQSSAGPCTGTIQVSRDGFASCIGLGAVTMSMGDQVAITTSAPALAFGITYKIRVTTGAQSAVGVPLASTFTQAIGFTTYIDRCATGLVISQVYGGGGNTSAPFRNDFIELHNPTTAPINLTGMAVQYTSATGSTWQVTPLPAFSLAPGAFFLIQEAAGANPMAPPLPTPDAVGTIPMSANQGKVVLTSNTTALTGACPMGPSVVDIIGYGAAGCFETAPAPLLSNTTSAQRRNGGCGDNGNNSIDYLAVAPEPRNSAAPAQACACSANESSALYELDYCNLQFPPSTTTGAGTPTELIFGRVYEAGVTEPAGPNPTVLAQIGFGPVSANPQNQPGWLWAPATFNLQIGNDDEYRLQITAPTTPGTYRYTARFSLDGLYWTYCDLDGAGSTLGLLFDPGQLGTLTVTP